jgi:hypothetical protein
MRRKQMIKKVAVYSLADGTDADQFWEYHTKIHAADVISVAGPALKRYVINRVRRVVRGTPQFFAFIETWWESEEGMNQYLRDINTTKLPNGKTIVEDFWSRGIQGFEAAVEELVMKE